VVASGSCSVDDTNYTFEDKEEGEAGAPSSGGSSPTNSGGASGTPGAPCTPPCASGGGAGRANTSGGRAASGGVVGTTGGAGSGNTSSGNAGSGDAGSGNAGSSNAGGTGNVGAGGGSGGNPCFPNPCQNGGYCYVAGAGYRCECSNGYEGPDCTDDVDECAATPGPCTNGEACRNFPGTFGCPCPVGFIGEECELPTLEWLTPFSNWRACYAQDVSDDGRVVVGYCSMAPTTTRAFRWTREDGMSSLGALGDESAAEAVSGDGQVIVGTYVTEQRHMFRWTAASGMQPELGLDDETGSYAYEVNADGSVVVGMSVPRGVAFRWSAAERLDLGTQTANGRAAAWGVSGDGTIVIGANENVGAAFRWTAATNLQLLPQPAREGSNFAKAISRDGKLIAGYGTVPGESWGLLWRGETVEILEGMDSYVRAVSDTGVVVSTNAVWNGQLRTPLQAIEDLGIVPDQLIFTTEGISADGKFYVGTGQGGSFIARAPD
jgi:probable HAF family extracellular repeat protein